MSETESKSYFPSKVSKGFQLGVGDSGEDFLLGFGIRFEVPRVAVVRHFGDDRRRELPADHVVPRDAAEEAVGLDVAGPALHVAEPLGPVGDEQPLDEVFGDRVQMLRPLDLPRQDLLVDAKRIVVEEGRVADQHLEDQDAQRPPIASQFSLSDFSLRRAASSAATANESRIAFINIGGF